MLSSYIFNILKNCYKIANNLSIYYDKRFNIFHKPRRVIGHKLEFIYGKHRTRVNPPRIPIHPVDDVAKDMKMFESYKDLKLRWKKSTKPSKRKMRIARKWRQPNYLLPLGEPTCIFVKHSNLPFTRNKNSFELNPQFSSSLNDKFEVYPSESVQKDIKERNVPIFCIFKSSPYHQHKVTIGDLVQVEKLHRKVAGDKVKFGTVLLVGSREWSIIGKPTVPYSKVLATVEQQTLTGDQISFYYRKKNRTSKFKRIRHHVTYVRIDDIIVDTTEMPNNDIIKPKRLLDLWSNRWLYSDEVDGVEKVMDKEGDSDELHIDNQHIYHKRGASDCYRWFPDPYSKHRGLR